MLGAHAPRVRETGDRAVHSHAGRVRTWRVRETGNRAVHSHAGRVRT